MEDTESSKHSKTHYVFHIIFTTHSDYSPKSIKMSVSVQIACFLQERDTVFNYINCRFQMVTETVSTTYNV